MLLVLFSPILIVIIFLNLCLQGLPIFFYQLRPGLNEKPFYLLKFRTMKEHTSKEALDDSERLTKFGQWLRSTSLDELPELVNILKGEMSFIGPRPLLIDYLPFYSKTERQRHHIKPGLSGWAQVNGRNLLDWEKKFELDVWYVKHCSFWLDLKILFLTIYTIFQRKGINANHHVTMERFDIIKKKEIEKECCHNIK